MFLWLSSSVSRLLRKGLAGAVGLEPTPSSLTVRCPADWTTPHPDEPNNLHDSRSNGNACGAYFLRRSDLHARTNYNPHSADKKEGAKKVGGRKPAQPSIPEGILGFLPPDAVIHRKPSAILNYLKTGGIAPDNAGKKVTGASKFFEVERLQVSREMSARRQYALDHA